MLSLFPELLDWSWYVPLLFRIFLGWYLVHVGYSYIRRRSPAEPQSADALLWGGILLALLGIAFFAGIFVQALGATGFILAATALYFRTRLGGNVDAPRFYVLVGLVALSLVFLGPGPLSFDLPL
jgi:uncharacterized membrane protein YfcA